MMRLLCKAMFVAALMTALVGCGSDDDGGTTPTPTGFTRLVAAHHQNPGLTSVDSPVWDSIAAGRINMGADAAYNAGLSATSGKTADLKALVAGDSLFIRATWTDGTVNNLFGRLHAVIDEDHLLTWETPDTIINNEDRFYIMFDENGTGCKRFCHTVANANGRKYYGSSSDQTDIWHWKAHRTGMALFTDPDTLGFAEDMHITDTMVAPDPQISGSDNLYFNNFNGALNKPRKMHTTGANFTGPGLVEGAWVDYVAGSQWIDSTLNPPVGRFVPGYYMQNLTYANGSRWDVRAMADHDGAGWTVVFCRKLTTTDLNDVDLTSASPDSVLINVAFGSNSGITHYGYKPFYLVVQ